MRDGNCIDLTGIWNNVSFTAGSPTFRYKSFAWSVSYRNVDFGVLPHKGKSNAFTNLRKI